MLHNLLATATDLDQWASLLESQSVFPELMRRLIRDTTPALTSLSFPSAEGVQGEGWDGLTTADHATPFVPVGPAGWELGTNKAQKGKADGDYTTRTADPLGLTPSKATFIFCTPRRWGARKKWVATKLAEGHWHDIRAYDADDLITWLTAAPATHVWLSRLLHKQPDGVQDLEFWWDAWAAQTTPPMQKEWLLAGRSAAQTGLINWLASKDSTLPTRSVFASTAEEARAFIASCILALPEEPRVACLAQAVVVTNEPMWQQLLQVKHKLLLIPDFESERFNQLQAAANQQGHRVLLPRAADELTSSDVVILPLNRDVLQPALERVNFSRLDAAEKASLARRSFTAFHRTLLTDKSLQRLWWQEAATAQQLLPLLLLNRWQAASPGDQLIVEHLTGQEYSAVEKQLQVWAQQPVAPVRHLSGEWFILDPADVWEQTALFLKPELLTKFSEAIHDVLGAPLARFNLPPAERSFAQLRGVQDDYSSTLRQGFTTSLALLGTHIPPVTSAQHVPAWVGNQVRQLLEHALKNPAGYLLTSLDYHLPALAEAAPDVFLTTILQGLRNAEPSLLKLFEEEPDLFQATAHHTGLLWALEALAWPPQYFSDACMALAMLARLDPGGRLMNRPINSLRTIFLPWHPQTNASVADRFIVLDRIDQVEPEISWLLLKLLLPSAHDSSSGSHVPTFHWRDWEVNPDRGTTWEEYFQFISGLTERVLKVVGTDPQRWSQLIDELPELLNCLSDQRLRDQVLTQLQQLAFLPIPEADRLALLKELRELLNRHRSFPDVDWAWSEGQLAPVDTLYQQLQPASLPVRHAWLFDEWPQLPEGMEHESSAETERIIAKRQEQALSELLTVTGQNAIAQLLPLVPNAFWLGRVCGQTTQFSTPEKLRLYQQYAGAAAEREANFAQGLASTFTRQLGDAAAATVAREQHDAWQPMQTAIWLAAMPMASATWELAQELGQQVNDEYWQRAWHYVEQDAEAPEAVRHFLDHHRPAEAVHVLSRLQNRSKGRLSSALVLTTLEALFSAQRAAGKLLVRRYELETLLNELPHAPDEDRSRAVRLAFSFSSVIPLKNPQLLNEELQRNPAFFVELLAALYKPDDAGATDAEPLSDEERQVKQAFGSHAWSVLNHWESVPGVQSDGSLDGEYLSSWVEVARRLAAERRVTKGFDIQLGLLLSHAPANPDKSWPPLGVCQLLENEAHNETITRHIHMGRYNIHGRTHTVDGGQREEKIAANYASWAQKIQTQFPVTARILRSLYDDFKREAEEQRRRTDREDQFGI